MSAVFPCPHCGKNYPNKSSLIGRKVRCADCKGVFQLQGDGKAVKIVLEDKKSQKVGSGSGTANQHITRQLTHRTKRVNVENLNARIEKSRTSLRDAADAALSRAAESVDAQVEEKPRSRSEKLASLKSMEIHRRQQRPAKFQLRYFWMAMCVLFLAVITGFIYLSEDSPAQKALDDFSERVDKEFVHYPLRMKEYRKRMWIYSRDGNELPPVFLNVNVARMDKQEELPWQRLVDICQKQFGGMSLLPSFAILVDSEKQAMVDQMWEQYSEKKYIEGFYKQLQSKGIRYIHCRTVPDLLKQEGVTDREIYIISLLLAGTSDEKGSPAKDFGLISTIKAQSTFICEFKGTGGMKLIERANDYDMLGSADFCGLALGFSGIPGRTDEWRILDLRHGKSMDDFFENRYNPFITLVAHVKSTINSQYGALEPRPDATPEGGVQ